MKKRFDKALGQIFELQDHIADLHPLLRQTFPVAIHSGNELWLYRPEPSARSFRHVGTGPVPFEFPQNIRAAFPLEELGWECACIVSENAFDSLEGYIFVFHEFVHCYQYTTCEEKLKATLEVAKVSMERQDAMWEIQYPFPYNSLAFIDVYKRQLEGDFSHRPKLRQELDGLEYEYLVWQEWKEGFARWLENRIRERLELPKNKTGSEQPYNRVSFYAGGAALIKHLSMRTPTLTNDLGNLFRQIRDYPGWSPKR